MDTAIQNLSYEDALSKLELVMNRLEKEDLPLEEALALYEQGVALAAHCSIKLDAAELRVRQWLPGNETKPLERWQESGKNQE